MLEFIRGHGNESKTKSHRKQKHFIPCALYMAFVFASFVCPFHCCIRIQSTQRVHRPAQAPPHVTYSRRLRESIYMLICTCSHYRFDRPKHKIRIISFQKKSQLNSNLCCVKTSDSILVLANSLWPNLVETFSF